MRRIAIMLALLLFSLGCSSGQSRSDYATLQIHVIDKAIKLFFEKHKAFPNKLDELLPFIDDGNSAIVDPWGRKFIYDVAGPHHGGEFPDVLTVTPDQRVICNWEAKK